MGVIINLGLLMLQILKTFADNGCSVTIQDAEQSRHTFRENSTTIGIDVRKGEVIFVEGDCCFQIFEDDFGQGNSQTLEGAGKHRYTLRKAASLFIVDCPRYNSFQYIDQQTSSIVHL